jgi:hypothetical protein
MTMPFTWSRLRSLTGDQLREVEKRRIKAAIASPTEETWAAARTIVVSQENPRTVWQCTERATLSRFPDGKVPGSEQIIQGLCYATAEQYHAKGSRL